MCSAQASEGVIGRWIKGWEKRGGGALGAEGAGTQCIWLSSCRPKREKRKEREGKEEGGGASSPAALRRKKQRLKGEDSGEGKER